MSLENSSVMVEEPDAILKALSDLTAGATLLKAGRSGRSHFRRFRLTPDLTRLTWESARRTDAAVLISQITELKRGQVTPVFKKNPLPECENRSFSLLYSGRSLDIVCKDKREYEVWTKGLQVLLDGFGDHHAVENYISQQGRGRVMTDGEKIKVDIGTLRTKVLVQESACDLYTWGSGLRGMLGHKDEDNEKLPRVVESLLGRDISMVACGVAHTMALSASGEVFTWGSGSYGRLGHGNLRDRFSPLMIGGVLRGVGITFVACHEFHSVAVADGGELFTWGKMGPHLGYELPDGVTKQFRPKKVEGLADQKVINVSCGESHTLVCTESGNVFVFGRNKYGELGLGHGSSQAVTVPTPIHSLNGIVKVACGLYHSAAIDDDGYLWMWGWGSRGQLGQGEMKNLNTPTRVDGFNNQPITDISCGDGHNLALSSTGVVYSWGDNSVSQLGLSVSYTEVTKPRQVNIPSGFQVTQVACGANFSAALTSVGRVFTWGYGNDGQLANNENKGRAQPVEVEVLLDKQVRMIACGAHHVACTVVHGWVPDEEAKDCMACNKSFTTIRRRHHCRKCGGVFCGACSAKRFPLLEQGYSDPVRVCERCYTVLTKKNSS